MSKIIAVTSAKGGVGKSTICCNLGKAFSNLGKKTLLVELDIGLRGLDLYFNVKEIVYDLGDVLNGVCSLKNSIINLKNYNNLFLIPAPFNFNLKITKNSLMNFFSDLKEFKFDYVLLDLKAGVDIAYLVKEFVNLFLVVVNPSLVCIRNSYFFNNFLQLEKEKTNAKLIINKFKFSFKKNSTFKTLDDIIDETKLQLIGLIPEKKEIFKSTQLGLNLKKNKKPFKIFNAIAKRIEGVEQKLLV